MILWAVVVLIILVLATARLTQVVVDDKIFAPIRGWFMKRFGEEGWPTYLVHCVACTSFWVGMLWSAYGCLAFNLSWWLFLPLGFALSYLTILLNDLRGS